MALTCIHIELYCHTPLQLLANTSLMPRSFDPASSTPRYMHKTLKHTTYGTHALMGQYAQSTFFTDLTLLRSQPTPQEPGVGAPWGVPSACFQVLRPAKHWLHVARIKRNPPPVYPARS